MISFDLFTMIDKENVIFLHITVKCVLASYHSLFQSGLSVLNTISESVI